MTDSTTSVLGPPADVAQTVANPDLEAVLGAWHEATERLRQTHEALRSEVRRLTDELEVKNRELARKNRLADLGQIASHIAHEVRNNLMPVSLYLSLLRRRIAEDAGSLDVLEKVEAGCTALDAMVNDLLNFTADRDPKRLAVNLRGLFEEVQTSLAPQIAAQNIDVAVEVPAELVISADRAMLHRAILNLVLNALDAMPDGGQLVVSSRVGPDTIELQIADSGPGLTEEAQQRFFEPFFTTKSNGIGLGLAIVDRIVQAHGGRLTVNNGPQGGAAFTICIPHRALEVAL